MVNPSLNIIITALTIWRENRGGGHDGMQSVLNVIKNRSIKRKSSLYEESIRPYQFSSMTAPRDPELILFPKVGDPQMDIAIDLATQASIGTLDDLTLGATVYYNPSGLLGALGRFTKPDGTIVPFPDNWDRNKLVYTTEVAGHLFFREV